jgi:hypothetical protein
MKLKLVSMTLAVTAVATVASATTAHGAVAPKRYANCAALNKVYPHGVGRPGAVDKVSGRTRPVTNFVRNKKVYDLNRGRDGDKDGVACERR